MAGSWMKREQLQITLSRIAPYVLLMLVVLLCWRLASLVWLAAAPPRVPTVAIQPLQLPPAPQAPNISSFALFHQTAPEPINAPVTPAPSAPLVDFASIPLHLEGVFVNRPDSQSRAVMRVTDKSLTYKVGQKLEATGLVLAAIHDNYVLVRHKDGSVGRLNFGDSVATAIRRPHGQPNGMGSSAAGTLPPNQPLPLGMPSLGQLPIGTALPAPTTGSASNAGVQAQLADAVQQLRTNSGTYLSKMGVRSTGSGYEVTAGAPDQIRTQLGLRPGDKIVSVNGQALGNPQNDAAILQQIQQSRSAQIELQRGSQTLTLSQNF